MGKRDRNPQPIPKRDRTWETVTFDAAVGATRTALINNGVRLI